jgi:hypothetical protein
MNRKVITSVCKQLVTLSFPLGAQTGLTRPFRILYPIILGSVPPCLRIQLPYRLTRFEPLRTILGLSDPRPPSLLLICSAYRSWATIPVTSRLLRIRTTAWSGVRLPSSWKPLALREDMGAQINPTPVEAQQPRFFSGSWERGVNTGAAYGPLVRWRWAGTFGHHFQREKENDVPAQSAIPRSSFLLLLLLRLLLMTFRNQGFCSGPDSSGPDSSGPAAAATQFQKLKDTVSITIMS